MQILLREVRNGKRSERDALRAHEHLTAMKLCFLGDRVSRHTAWRIAREHDWDTLRDADYLAISRLQADALVTIDASLAARVEGVVRVAPVDALLEAD